MSSLSCQAKFGSSQSQAALYNTFARQIGTRGLIREAIVNLSNPMHPIQFLALKVAFLDPEGPFSQLSSLAINISGPRPQTLIDIIPYTILPSLTSHRVNIADLANRVEVQCLGHRKPGLTQMKQETSLAIPMDATTESLYPYLNLLTNVTRLNLLSPNDTESFESCFLYVVEGLAEGLRDVLPSLHSVVLPLGSPRLIQPIFMAFGALPTLEVVELSLPTEIQSPPPNYPAIQAALKAGLEEFHHLHVLILPGEVLGFEVAETIASLEDLRALKLLLNETLGYDGSLRAIPGSFRALERLEIVGHLTSLQVLYNTLGPIKALKKIYLKVPFLEAPAEANNAWRILHNISPNLQVLHFVVEGLHPFETREWFGFENLRKIASTQLAELVICHPRPLNLPDSVIVEFLMKAPCLRTLWLNPSPRQASPRTNFLLPTWELVKYVAKNNWPLKRVGIYLGLPPIIWDYHMLGSVNNMMDELTLGTYAPLDSGSPRTLTNLGKVFGKAKIRNVCYLEPDTI